MLDQTAINMILEEVVKGKTMVVEVLNESELNSTRVRFYKARQQYLRFDPEIESKVQISQQKKDGKFLVVLSKPDVKLVYERDQDGTLHKVNLFDDRITTKLSSREERQIRLMVQDDEPEESVLDYIATLDEHKRVRATFFFNVLKPSED